MTWLVETIIIVIVFNRFNLITTAKMSISIILWLTCSCCVSVLMYVNVSLTREHLSDSYIEKCQVHMVNVLLRRSRHCPACTTYVYFKLMGPDCMHTKQSSTAIIPLRSQAFKMHANPDFMTFKNVTMLQSRHQVQFITKVNYQK